MLQNTLFNHDTLHLDYDMNFKKNASFLTGIFLFYIYTIHNEISLRYNSAYLNVNIFIRDILLFNKISKLSNKIQFSIVYETSNLKM